VLFSRRRIRLFSSSLLPIRPDGSITMVRPRIVCHTVNRITAFVPRDGTVRKWITTPSGNGDKCVPKKIDRERIRTLPAITSVTLKLKESLGQSKCTHRKIGTTYNYLLVSIIFQKFIYPQSITSSSYKRQIYSRYILNLNNFNTSIKIIIRLK